MVKHKSNPEQMEERIKALLLNGITSKSGITLASSDVLKAIAERLGYSIKDLKE